MNQGLIRILRSIVWLFFQNGLNLIVGLFVGAWVARHLGPEKMGVVGAAIALALIFKTAAGLGLEKIVVRNLVENETTQGVLLSSARAMQFISGVVAYLLLLVVGWWVKAPMLLYVVVGIDLFLQPFLVPVFWYRAKTLPKPTVIAAGCGLILAASLRIALILSGNTNVVYFAATYIAQTMITAVVVNLLFKAEVLGCPKFPKPSLAMIRKVRGESMVLLVGTVCAMALFKIDIAMVATISSSTEAGIYLAAARVSEITYFVPAILASSLFPAIVRSKTNSDVYFHRMAFYYKVSAATAYGIIVVLLLFHRWIIEFLYGISYSGAGAVLLVHAWTCLPVFLGGARQQWLLSDGLVWYWTAFTVVGAALNVLLNLMLIPSFGALGAAYASLISYTIASIFSSILTRETRRQGLAQIGALLWPIPSNLKGLLHEPNSAS